MKNIFGNIPLILVISIFLTGILPSVLSQADLIGVNLEDSFILGGGIYAVDVVLLIMFGMVIYKIFTHGKKNQIKDKYLFIAIVLFSIWILFEIFRNIGVYGLSAPGEFRFRYLILALPLFVAVNFDTKRKREKLLNTIIILSFFVPLLMIPFIGFVKGWQFGPENRFLNSQIHLGMLYGYTALLWLKKYKQIRFSNLFLITMSLPYFFFFIIDSHRSVWLAAAVIIVTLLFLKEIRIQKVIYLLPIGIVLLFIIVMQLQSVGIDLGKYISERGIAFVNPEQDQSSRWRLLIWQAQFESFLNTPLVGQGFGGYFYSYIPGLGDVEISPHSLYIQSLVKIGLIGLLLYAIIFTMVFNKLKNAYSFLKLKQNSELPLIILGIVILIAAHFYYSVYALEYYSLIYIGLAVAVSRDKSNYLQTV